VKSGAIYDKLFNEKTYRICGEIKKEKLQVKSIEISGGTKFLHRRNNFLS
jgi:hypothetical protein